jgi:penicillin amidase
MRRLLKTLALTLTALTLAMGAWLAWTVSGTLPEREGSVAISGLKAPVTVRYDERGVPHIRADNEIDLYRALGYVHAQERLLQMEMMRRLANGELAEILGPALLDTDRLFRTLGLRQHAQQRAAQMDRSQASSLALAAYLDGINQFQESDRLPIEFRLLGIEPRDFSAQDVWAVSGYLAYSFAAAFRTEPVLTHIRDQLGPSYLRIFQTEGLSTKTAPLEPAIAQSLAQVASLSLQAIEEARLPLQHGSNAWALSGSRTASGKPLLAGDPHISFALPSVWYEAHLQAPGFELYGYHQALSPFALIGHTQAFAWSLTMFQNDDIDFVAEKIDPSRPDQVWHQGRWVPLQVTQELIAVKGQAPTPITLRRSPHGPLITDVFRPALSQQAVALWWTFLE